MSKRAVTEGLTIGREPAVRTPPTVPQFKPVDRVPETCRAGTEAATVLDVRVGTIVTARRAGSTLSVRQAARPAPHGRPRVSERPR